MMAPHELFVPRRVGVCGSSKDLPPEAVLFCEAVGEQLANQSNVVIVSGGSRWREGASEDNLAAHWHIVNAAAEQVRRISGAEQVEQRIETVVSDQVAKGTYFNIGSSRRARGKTREARRFSFVQA